MNRLLNIATIISLTAGTSPAIAQAPSTPPAPQQSSAPKVTFMPSRPTPPTRDPHTPGYVKANELPDGANAPANADGNYILGPTHTPVPETARQEGVPEGTIG